MKRLSTRGVAATAGKEASAQPKAAGGGDVGEMLEPIRKKHDLPALAAAVYYRGRVAGSGVTGVRKYGDPVPAALSDPFHIGSCTKSMTATLVAMLVEEKKLDWNAPLTTYFPEMRGTMAAGLQKVTLAQLACHRSGITSESWPKSLGFKQLHDLPGSYREQRQIYAKHILQEQPAAEPGVKYIYANRNYALLGIVAERVAGEEWEALITRRLFKPLGMTSAGFQAMGTPGRVDAPWQHRIERFKRVQIEPGKYSDNPQVIGPAGTVHCSITDWLKYVAAHTQGETGGSHLLKAETFQFLHTPQFGGDYAFGWLTTQRSWGGGTVLTHAGSNTMSFAVVWVAPRRDFAIVACTNQAGGGAEEACDEVAATMIRTFLR